MRRRVATAATTVLASALVVSPLSGCTPRYERMVRVTPDGYGTSRPEVVMSFEGEDMPEELRHVDDFRVYRSTQRLTGPRTWTAEPESRLSPTAVPVRVRGEQLVLDVGDVPEGVHELWAEWDDTTTTQDNAVLVVDLHPPTLTFEAPRKVRVGWETRARWTPMPRGVR